MASYQQNVRCGGGLEKQESAYTPEPSGGKSRDGEQVGAAPGGGAGTDPEERKPQLDERQPHSARACPSPVRGLTASKRCQSRLGRPGRLALLCAARTASRHCAVAYAPLDAHSPHSGEVDAIREYHALDMPRPQQRGAFAGYAAVHLGRAKLHARGARLIARQ